jgi:hypothetical protein
MALALHSYHAVIKEPGEHHVPQPHLQVVGIELRVPGPDGCILFVQNPDHLECQATLDVAQSCVEVRPRNRGGW